MLTAALALLASVVVGGADASAVATPLGGLVGGQGALPGGCQAPSQLGVTFVLDDSGSMSSSDPDTLRATATGIGLDAMPDGSVGAASSFSDGATQIFPPTVVYAGSRPGLTNSVRPALYSFGGTDYDSAFTEAQRQLRAMPATVDRKAVVFLSDGLPNYPFTADQEIDNEGIPIFAVGFNDADPSIMDGIAARSAGQSFHPATAADIQQVFAQIVSQLTCDQPVLSTSADLPPGTSQSFPFTVDPATRGFRGLVAWAGDTPLIGLLRPDGTDLSALQRTNETWQIGATFLEAVAYNPDIGQWVLQVSAPATAADTIHVTVDLWQRNETLPPDAPGLTAPADGAEVPRTGGVPLAWSPSRGAETYTLVLDGTSYITGINSTTATVNVSGIHTWQIIAVNKAGAASSAVRTFAADDRQALIRDNGFAWPNVGLNHTNAITHTTAKIFAGTFVDLGAYIQTYGENQIWTRDKHGNEVLNPKAMDAFAADVANASRLTDKDDGGQCLGFASTTSLHLLHPASTAFLNTTGLSALYPSPLTPTGAGEPILALIHARHTIQDNDINYKSYRATWQKQGKRMTWTVLHDTIKKYLDAGSYPMLDFGTDGYDHSVVVLGIDDHASQHEYDIRTLDSDTPDESGVKIEVTGTKFTTPASYLLQWGYGYQTEFEAGPVDADHLMVVPPALAGEEHATTNWVAGNKAQSFALTSEQAITAADVTSIASGITITATAGVSIGQVTGGGRHLLTSDGSVDRGSKGIPGAVSSGVTDGGSESISLPNDSFTVALHGDAGATLTVERGDIRTSVSFTQSGNATAVLPASAQAPLIVASASTLQETVISTSGSNYRVASVTSKGKLGLAIAANGTVRLAGSPKSLSLSAVGPSYDAASVTLASVPAGAQTVASSWGRLTSPVSVGLPADKTMVVKTRTRALLRSASVRARKVGKGVVRVALSGRTSGARGVAVRGQLVLRGKVVATFSGGHISQTWTIRALKAGTYTVKTTVSAFGDGGAQQAQATSSKLKL